MSNFYVTTPIYYVNQPPHVGTAYTTIAADVLARFYRLQGSDVFFLTGTDEHGTKVQESAEKSQKKPQEFTDEIVAKFKKAWRLLGISNDNFIRTTDPHHEQAVSQVLQQLYDEEYIYKGIYKAFYCVGCEQYKTKSELVEGKCPDHHTEPEERAEECYLFRLSSFQEKLLELIEKDSLKIEPLPRRNEMLSFLGSEKLQDLAISRAIAKVSWGIPLPFDPSHTTYVWVDAFLNYLTGLGWPEDKENFQRYWPADIQLMAKDILRVHATIWPALLLALKLDLPKRFFVHGYFTVNGQKMSKSLGNVINPNTIVKKYGADTLRYFILSEFPFGTDGDFSLKRLEESYNFDLANDLGNLLHRSAPMFQKYRQGRVPPPGEYTSLEKDLIDNVARTKKEIPKLMEDMSFRQVLSEIWALLGKANKYIDAAAPWSLAREGEEAKLDTALYSLAETIRLIVILIYPFMPETASSIWSQIGIEENLEKQSFEESLKWGKTKPGNIFRETEALFPRIE